MKETHDNGVAERILRVSVALFASKGYSATSTREIAQAAGITKPMLYYYYGSKEGLRHAALLHYGRDTASRFDGILASPLTARERLVEVAWSHLSNLVDEPDYFRFAMISLFGPSEECPKEALQEFAQLMDSYHGRIVDQAVAEGIVAPDSRDLFLSAFRGILISYTIERQLGTRLEIDRPLAEEIIRRLLQGFRPGDALGQSP
ncbi:MAG TPA: TetR/AcrR family transcriptional regulator [Armatimonadota bacterium]